MQKNPISRSGIFNPRVLLAFTLSFVAVAAVFGGVDSSRFSAFGNLPLSFEPNVGQIDPAARFIARASGATFYFTPSGFVSVDLQMKLLGGRPAREIAGIDRVG